MGQRFGTAMMRTNEQIQQRKFGQDEKCWVTRSTRENDGVCIDLYSDPYNDVHFYGTVKIAYPDKKTVPPADSFLQTVAEVLTVVPSGDEASQGGQQGPAPAQAPAAAHA